MRFIDLHAHLPMHTPFPPVPFADPKDNWKTGLFKTLNRTLNYERLQPRVSLKRWSKDDGDVPVTGFGSVLYDPEDEFFVKDGHTPIPEAFDHITAQLSNVEAEMARLGPDVRIARNPREVGECVQTGQRFIFHTLEGGFSLGGCADNVRRLAALGVASIAPAHLLYRGVATCENGFPPAAHLLFKNELEHQPDIGLSDVGQAIVAECFERGVIVDITHAREDAQTQIFDIAAGYPTRPVISSHNSVRAINDAGLNLSDNAIRRIKATNGVIGVIFYTHWLRRGQSDDRSEVELITDVIDHVENLTEGHDHVAIGSDLDGFIEPVEMGSNYSKMSAVSDALIHKYGEAVAEKILYRNALRVLDHGWDGVQRDGP